MDLSSLDSTLPPALADAEREMGDKFRGKSTGSLLHAGCPASTGRYAKHVASGGQLAALVDLGWGDEPPMRHQGLIIVLTCCSFGVKHHNHVQVVLGVHEGKPWNHTNVPWCMSLMV